MNLKINKHHWTVWIYRATFGVSQATLPTNLCNFFWKWLIALLAIPFISLHLVFAFVMDRKNPDKHSFVIWVLAWVFGLIILWLAIPKLGEFVLKAPFVNIFYTLPLVGALIIIFIIAIGRLISKTEEWFILLRFNKRKDVIRRDYYPNDTWRGPTGVTWQQVLEDKKRQLALMEVLKYERKFRNAKVKSDGIWKIISKKYSSFKDNYCPHIEWLDKK